MLLPRITPLTFILFLAVLSGACKRSAQTSVAWEITLPELGTGSSPKCADLNGDGVLDIVLGAGRNELELSDSAVLAFDGKDGRLLWTASAVDQIVGTAMFMDLTKDGVPEVFIGGRSSEMICINGKDGDVIWRFHKSDETPLMACCLRFNFFNAQFVPDADGDGINDLLVTNGGNPVARPHSKTNRYPGTIAVMSSASGNIIVADTMPDGAETYMTPVIHHFEGDAGPSVIVGTGGETLGGRLFRFPYHDLLNGNISNAIVLSSKEKFGFMGPPTLADINHDRTKDIIVNWFGGAVMAIHGKSNQLLWELPVANTESYSTPAPGYFNNDSTPDFFSIFNRGAWPKNIGSIQILVDGKTGKELFRDSIGCMGYSSPVTVDVNADGFDEAIFSVNEYVCDGPAFMGDDIINSKHRLMVYDDHEHAVTPLIPQANGKNISTTPWIGDMDGDQQLDIVYCVQRNNYKVDRYSGIKVVRLQTNIDAASVSWSSYLGHSGNSVFEDRTH